MAATLTVYTPLDNELMTICLALVVALNEEAPVKLTRYPVMAPFSSKQSNIPLHDTSTAVSLMFDTVTLTGTPLGAKECHTLYNILTVHIYL